MRSRKAKAIKESPRATDVLSLDAVLEILQSPKKLAWLNFKAGFIRGFAGLLGVVLAILLLSFLVSLFGGLPYVGDFLQKLYEALQTRPKV